MSKLYSLLFIVLLVFPNFALAIQTDDSKAFVITNVNVIPMDSERVLKNQSVVIESGKITALGSKIKTPTNAVVINGAGKYLIPGLFDMHIHIREGSEKDLEMYLANGVTTIQSMHGSPWHLALREKISKSELLAPRFFTTGPTTATARVNSPEEAEKFVLEQKKAGYDLDKAFEVLKLNTEYFPDAFNTWDSLAEVYMLKGDKEAAIKFYKKSLELNPNNTNAVDQIKKLKGEN